MQFPYQFRTPNAYSDGIQEFHLSNSRLFNEQRFPEQVVQPRTQVRYHEDSSYV